MYHVDSQTENSLSLLTVLKDIPTLRFHGMLNYEDGNIHYKFILNYFSHYCQL